MIREKYELQAAQCLLLANQTTNSKNKLALMEMARAWLRLADQAEKNSHADLVYETPSRPADRTDTQVR